VIALALALALAAGADAPAPPAGPLTTGEASAPPVATADGAGEPAPRPASGAAERFARANALLEAGDAGGAARAYEALLAEGLESASLHVNLGAARLRAGRRGAAIASFERALRLDPRDPDARAYLALARSRNADRLGAGADASLLARIAERTPDRWAAAALAAPWAALWLALALRRRRVGRARSLAGLAAAAAALATAAGGALLAARAAGRHARTAVVIAAEAPVRDGPEEALRPTFVLHEGASLRVVEARGGALRVRLANGLEGWIAARDVEEP